MQIPTGFKRVPDTEHYALSPEGFVYNVKTGKRLKRFFDGYKIRSAVVDRDGKSILFAHDKIDAAPPPVVTREDVLENARVVADYPDYAVTYWGLVWRINPRKKGPNAGRIHVLEEHVLRGKGYVQLADPDGKRKKIQTYKLTKEVWGDDCSCLPD